MKTTFFLFTLVISIFVNSQCNFFIDTTFLPINYNANILNSLEIENYGLCIDSIYPDSGQIHVEFIADSESGIFEWYDIPQPGCTSGIFHAWRLFDSQCNQINHTTTPWYFPYSGWPGFGAKHFDNLTIGDTYYLEMDYDRNGKGCDAFKLCLWYYSVGDNFLDLYGVDEYGFVDPYPNPCNEILNFELPESQLFIQIANMSGQVVMIREKPKGQTKLSLETLDIDDGMYICTFFSNSVALASRKIIINH